MANPTHNLPPDEIASKPQLAAQRQRVARAWLDEQGIEAGPDRFASLCELLRRQQIAALKATR